MRARSGAFVPLRFASGRVEPSSGLNCAVERSRPAIASRLASPTYRLIVSRSDPGLQALLSLYWRRAKEEDEDLRT
jgi:hypothetical protein